jgi:DNA polymerase delta subunit 2
MQQSWRVDVDKLTFIICRPEDHPTQTRDGRLDPDSMIGDVNLFISIAEDDAQTQMVVGELELMIAEQTEQRKGYGRAALLTFLNYILRHEGPLLAEFQSAQSVVGEASQLLNYFAVKIGETNHRSIALFESLGFRKTSAVPSYFGEYEVRLGRDEAQTALLAPGASHGACLETYREIEYSCP